MKITLLWKYLKHDIEQLAHRYVQLRLADNPDVADMANFGSNQSDEQLELRYVLTAVGSLRRVLREYLENRNTDANDKLSNTQQWEFKFVKELFDSYGLAELMHWFVVKWSVWQWTQVFSPNDAALAKSELSEVEEDIKIVLMDAAIPVKQRRDVYTGTEETEITYIPDNIEITYES